MPQIVLTVECLIQALGGVLNMTEFRLVAIGGNLFTGKTTLARRMGKELKLHCVHLDDYLNLNPGIDLPGIQHEIELHRIKGRPVIVEGVGVRRVFDELQYKHDLLVYLLNMPRQEHVASDPFYLESTTKYSNETLSKYHDDQTISRGIADILVERSE